MYRELADRAGNRVTAAFVGERPVEAVLDPYNLVGSTAHVRFNTTRRAGTPPVISA